MNGSHRERRVSKVSLISVFSARDKTIFKMTHLTERAKRAAEIISHPKRYKVCEGCESIVTAKVNSCPNCHSYRFDSDLKRIVSQAKLLGSRPQTSVKPEDLLE